MFCTSCGKNIPEGSTVCSYCRQPIVGRYNNAGSQPVNGYSANGAYYGNVQGVAANKIDNIFSALGRGKNAGIIMEFVLWCVSCLMVLVSFIIAILSLGSALRITWFLLCFFSIGYAVLSALRLKPILMFYSVISFEVILCGLHYIICSSVSKVYAWSDYFYGLDFLDGFTKRSYSPLNVIIFSLTSLVAIAAAVCSGIHFFTKKNLGKISGILVMVNVGLNIFLYIMVYAAPYLGSDANVFRKAARMGLDDGGYWYGTICLWIMLTVVMLHFIFFFWGAMDSSNDKIVIINKAATNNLNNQRISVQSASNLGLQGVYGIHAGKTYLLNGGMITIGSAPNMTISIPFAQISKNHCAIRFNGNMGCYEVYDNSTNGVILAKTGIRLRKGVYNPVGRGEIIMIGDNNQQFRLL